MKKIFVTIILLGLSLTRIVYAEQPGLPQAPESIKSIIRKIETTESSKVIQLELATGETITSTIEQYDPDFTIEYKKGDKVIVQRINLGEETKYIITDFNRIGYLGFLLFLFVLMSVAIGKKYGIYSLLGMGLSFLVIFRYVLPKISTGANPVLVTIIASIFIIPATFYLSHGFNKKTHVAVISTFISLIITSIFAAISVNLARLTGFASDEATFLQLGNSEINMRGILLSGIIIGFLGVMDDVTVSQSGIVMKLATTKRGMSIADLYTNAMDIGRDHITSMINTLILVYTGAALPLMLMFIQSQANVMTVLNTELIADEVVRTLVGSIGLIISVPISTFLAALVANEE